MAGKQPKSVVELKKMFSLGNKEKGKSYNLIKELGIDTTKLRSIKC